MRALVTRPEEDSGALAAELARRGIESLLQPMLEIAPLPAAPLDLAGVQALLATSANGVRAFAARSPRRDVPLLAVGEATARTATALGFSAVDCAAGDVLALARLAAHRLLPAAGPLLHIAGSAVAGDLAGHLAQDGFTVRRAVLYEARPVAAFRPETAAALRDGSLDMALFFSPRTAAGFATVAVAAGLAEACRRLAAFCLSQAVAGALAPLSWRQIRLALHPDQAHLLAAIDGYTGKSAS